MNKILFYFLLFFLLLSRLSVGLVAAVTSFDTCHSPVSDGYTRWQCKYHSGTGWYDPGYYYCSSSVDNGPWDCRWYPNLSGGHRCIYQMDVEYACRILSNGDCNIYSTGRGFLGGTCCSSAVNGKCGSANGKNFCTTDEVKNAQRCEHGSVDDFVSVKNNSGNLVAWTWHCNASGCYGGNPSGTCTAYDVDGLASTCGPANGGSFSTTPTDLCSSGSPSGVTFHDSSPPSVKYVGSAYTNKSSCKNLGGRCGQFANNSSPDSGTTCRVTGHVDYGTIVTGKCDGDSDVRCCVPKAWPYQPNTYTWTCSGQCTSPVSCWANNQPCPAAEGCPGYCHTNTYDVPNGSCGVNTCWANAPAAQGCPTTCHTNTYDVPNGSCGVDTCWANAPAAQSCPSTCHTNTYDVPNGNCGINTCWANAPAAGTCPVGCRPYSEVDNGNCGKTACPAITPIVGVCGSANGGSYYNIGLVPDASLCSGGSVVNKTVSDTEYTWQCLGATDRSCAGALSPVCRAVRNRYSWFQTNNGGVLANTSVIDRVPPTCTTASSCTPLISINGLVAAPSVSNSDGMGYFSSGNKYVQSKLGFDILSFYSKYLNLGIGETLNGDKTSADLVGKTGLILVNGKVTINDNNGAISPGSFLMVVANNNIDIASNVTNLNGIYVGKNINITGEYGTALTVNGSLYGLEGILVSRNFNAANASKNRNTPVVRVNFRPDFVFNMPAKLSQGISSWRWGN